MKKIKQFAMKKIADDYILIPRYETAEEMSDVITLSETAAYIYQLVDQCETIAELTEQVSRYYHIDAAVIAADIEDTLHQLAAAGLITRYFPENRTHRQKSQPDSRQNAVSHLTHGNRSAAFSLKCNHFPSDLIRSQRSFNLGLIVAHHIKAFLGYPADPMQDKNAPITTV